MSDEKTYTERDIILAKREAFMAGRAMAGTTSEQDREDARREYPLPPITRPRTIGWGQTDVRLMEWNGRPMPHFRNRGETWWGPLVLSGYHSRGTPVMRRPINDLITPEKLRDMLTLFESPTETVEDDA